MLASRDEFEALRCRILFVSFSDPSRPLQRQWIEQWCLKNHIPIPASTTSTTTTAQQQTQEEPLLWAQMVLDPNKALYEGWSIPSSQVAAWGPANTWYYIRSVCCRRHRALPKVQGNFEEAGQLGADVLLEHSTININSNGDDSADGDGSGTTTTTRVLLAYYCKNPTDRVSVSTILNTLQRDQKKK